MFNESSVFALLVKEVHPDNSVNRSIGMSPFEVVHGYKARKPPDLLSISPHVRISESAHAFVQHIHKLH